MVDDTIKIINSNRNHRNKRRNRLQSSKSENVKFSFNNCEATIEKLTKESHLNQPDLNKRGNAKSKTYIDKALWMKLVLVSCIFALVIPSASETINTTKEDNNDNHDINENPKIIIKPDLGSCTANIDERKNNPRPRIVQIETYNDINSLNGESLDTKPKYYSKTNKANTANEAHYNQKRKRRLQKNSKLISNSYKEAKKGPSKVHYQKRPPLGKDDACIYQYSWQNSSFPLTCNTVHEVNIRSFFYGNFIANGYYRDVWKIPTNNTNDADPTVIKTIRMNMNFTEKLLDKHRVDAVIMEKLSASQNILPIYGYCGYSGLFPLSERGDLEHNYIHLTEDERFQTAIDVASAIADMHFCGDNKDLPVIAHADITTKQFLHFNGHYVLNDFNRARLLKWNFEKQQMQGKSVNETCSFQIKVNKGKNRSPEEYSVGDLTEKIDVYSMGNIFYRLIENKASFYQFSKNEVYKMVKKGKRPIVSNEIRKNGGPKIQTLIEAMDMCFIQEAKSRPSAKEVLSVLLKARDKFDL